MNPLFDAAALREHFGAPTASAADKIQPELTDKHRAFIRASCFIILATSDAEGRMDVSPRGGEPGFVQVASATRLLIPDLKGNRRVDSMNNLSSSPRIGLLFFVPGVNESLRVSGSARVVALPPEHGTTGVAIEVDVEEAFHQCPKALLRAQLWKRGAEPASEEPPRMSSRPDDGYEL